MSLLILWILAVEVQSFFLKYILWIPARNLLNTYRLIIWFGKGLVYSCFDCFGGLLALGLPAVREYFEFLENRSVGESVGEKLGPKLGPFAWLGAAVSVFVLV